MYIAKGFILGFKVVLIMQSCRNRYLVYTSRLQVTANFIFVKGFVNDNGLWISNLDTHSVSKTVMISVIAIDDTIAPVDNRVDASMMCSTVAPSRNNVRCTHGS